MKNKSMFRGFVCVLALLGLATSASAQVVFLDNYETTPAGVAAGSPPPSPYVVSGTNSVSTVTVVSGVSQSSPNSLNVVDTDGNLPGYKRPFGGVSMPDGRLGFDFRFDPTMFNTGGGAGLFVNSPRTNNFNVEAEITEMFFVANGGSATTNVTFGFSSASGTVIVTNNFPFGSFQHIDVGWAGVDNGGAQGAYYVAWNGTTNAFTPMNGVDFTNITSFSSGSASQGGFDTFSYYIDNLQLAIPEPSVAALSLMSGFAVLFLRRKQ